MLKNIVIGSVLCLACALPLAGVTDDPGGETDACLESILSNEICKLDVDDDGDWHYSYRAGSEAWGEAERHFPVSDKTLTSRPDTHHDPPAAGNDY